LGSLDVASGYGGNGGYGYYDDCYNVRPSTKSVWYLVEGDGSCYTASAVGSTFETVVAIYDGRSCDGLSCSAQSENGSDISWETRIGETYYILVGGLYDRSGVFSLNIEVCDRTTILPVVFSLDCCLSSIFLFCFWSQRGECPSNDRCSTATSIDAANLPYIESASNSLSAAVGDGSPATSCNIVEGSAKTLWYELIGDGSCLSASVAGEDFQAVLALYEGESCGSISCAAQTEYDDRGRLSWRSVNGATYRILVSGAYGGQAGDFLLAVAVR
jgi:hypothetical protein